MIFSTRCSVYVRVCVCVCVCVWEREWDRDRDLRACVHVCCMHLRVKHKSKEMQNIFRHTSDTPAGEIIKTVSVTSIVSIVVASDKVQKVAVNFSVIYDRCKSKFHEVSVQIPL